MLSVAKYFPERLYGFLRDADGSDVYFHVGDFDPKSWVDPPPIVGERVDVVLDFDQPTVGQAKKALKVTRMDAPREVEGVVVSFGAERGWGFITGDDGTDYYLHRSEVLQGLLPAEKQRVTFYAGYKNDRPRACYVRIEE